MAAAWRLPLLDSIFGALIAEIGQVGREATLDNRRPNAAAVTRRVREKPAEISVDRTPEQVRAQIAEWN